MPLDMTEIIRELKRPTVLARAAASEWVESCLVSGHGTTRHDIEPLAHIIDQHMMIDFDLDRFERRGDAIIRWIVTITATFCGAAISAVYVATYLAGK